jgi:hypothetical protein
MLAWRGQFFIHSIDLDYLVRRCDGTQILERSHSGGQWGRLVGKSASAMKNLMISM